MSPVPQPFRDNRDRRDASLVKRAVMVVESWIVPTRLRMAEKNQFLHAQYGVDAQRFFNGLLRIPTTYLLACGKLTNLSGLSRTHSYETCVAQLGGVYSRLPDKKTGPGSHCDR